MFTLHTCVGTAVLFIRHVATIIVAVTDPKCWDTVACVMTLEPALTAPYTVTTKIFSHFR